MALVEIIRGEQTDDQTLAYALDLVARLGKVPVVVNDACVLPAESLAPTSPKVSVCSQKGFRLC